MAGSSEASHCSPVLSGADFIVDQGWTDFRGFAQEAYDLAVAKINTLGSFTVDSTPISISYAFPATYTPFIAPTAPTRTIGVFTAPDVPTAPELTEVTLDLSDVGAAPSEPTGLPVYSAPARPDVSLPTAPDVTVELDALAIPDAPSYTLPPVPVFVELNLPDVPTFNLPTFEGVRPDVTGLQAPANTFNFTEVAYSSDLLDDVRAVLATMGQGGTGLPAAVEQALFDRARGREDQLAAQDVATALDEWARLGYEEPSGVLNNRVERIRQRAQDKQATLSRDIYIQAQTVEIENLRFFVEKGIALESALMQTHMAVQERALRFAQAALAASIDIFNAEINKEQLNVAVYQADAAVFRDRIQGEIARAELYKTQIEGELAKGQVNEQLVRRYEAQLKTIDVLVGIYKVSVDAVKARGEINTQRIEAKRAEVQLYAAQVGGYTGAWEGFKAQVEGELGNVRMAQLATERYATLTSAWQTKNNVATARLQGELAIEAQKLQRADNLLRAYLGQVQAESSRMQAESGALQAEASVYQAAGSIAQAQSAAEDRQLQTQIATMKADAELQLKRGEISITTTIQRAQLLLDAMKSLGTISAQLAASAMSAVNLSANLSNSASNSSSCSTNFSFTGELS